MWRALKDAPRRKSAAAGLEQSTGEGGISSQDQEQLRDDAEHPRRVRRRCGALLRERGVYRSCELRVVCATWNVGEAAPLTGMLEWLRCGTELSPDVVCVSLQEVDMSVGAMATDKTQKGIVWLRNVHSQLGGPSRYQALEPAQLVGLMLMVFVRAELAPECSDVAGDVVKLGGGGLTGNKGGIAMRLSLRGRRLCFIGAHLAADIKHYEKRNDNWLTLTKALTFDVSAGEAESELAPAAAEAPEAIARIAAPGRRKLHLSDADAHDYVFWLGDLNYRLDGIGEAEAKKMAAERRWSDLLAYDQLLRARRNGDSFTGFEEADIQWAPTYKYDIGTHDYTETKGDEAKHGKQRVPAYCDRVLYSARKAPGCSAVVEAYLRFEFTISDHRPVSCLFRLEATRVKEGTRQAIGAAAHWAELTERRAACARRVARFIGAEHECLIDGGTADTGESFRMRLRDEDPAWWRPLLQSD